MTAMYKPIDIDTVDPFSLPSMPMAEFKNLPTVSGVYFAIKDSGAIAYIGETVNVQQRIKGHRIRKDLAGESVRIAWLEMPDHDWRSEAEGRLINRYKPELNIKAGPALPDLDKIKARIAFCESKIAPHDPERPYYSAHWINERKRAISNLNHFNRRQNEKRQMYEMLNAIAELQPDDAYTKAVALFRLLRPYRTLYFNDRPVEGNHREKPWVLTLQVAGETWMTVGSDDNFTMPNLSQAQLDLIQGRSNDMHNAAQELERQLPENLERERQEELDYAEYVREHGGA